MTAPDPTNCRACLRRERDGAPLTDLGCICGATLDFDPFATTSAAPAPRPRLKGTGPRSLNRDDAAVTERDNRRVLKGGR